MVGQVDEHGNVAWKVGDQYYPLKRFPGDRAKELAELDLHLNTLHSARRGALVLADILNDRLNAFGEEAKNIAFLLFTGIVFSYARCFDPTQKNSRLDENAVFAGNPAGRRWHDEIMLYRSKHLAHDVNALRDSAVGVVFLPDGVFEVVRSNFILTPDQNIMRNVGRLIRDTLQYCESTAAQVLADLMAQAAAMPAGVSGSLPTIKYDVAGHTNMKKARRSAKPTGEADR